MPVSGIWMMISESVWVPTTPRGTASSFSAISVIELSKS